MSGNLDDLSVELKAELSKAMAGFKSLESQMMGVHRTVVDIDASLNVLANSGAVSAQAMELVALRTRPLQDGLDHVIKQAKAMEVSFTQKLITQAVEAHAASMSKMAENTRQAKLEMISLSDASRSVRAPERRSSGAGAAAGSGINFVRVAAVAGQMVVLTRVDAALNGVRSTMTALNQTSVVTASAMDRFRLGLYAAKVNPELNTLPGLIERITSRVASSVESFRGFGDATISGIPAILGAVAKGMGSVMGAGDSLQATVAKLASEMELKKAALDRVAKIYPTAGTAIATMKTIMDTVAPVAQKVAEKVDQGADSMREAAVWARNLGYIATGTFIKTGTSADMYARGAYHALLPTRLMAFEAKFAQGTMTLLRRAFVAITHPVHAVQIAIAKSKGEFREMRSMLPPLSGGLQLGTRAFRAFSHATYFTSTAVRGAIGALRPLGTLAMAGARGIAAITSPARSAATSLIRLVGVQDTFIGRALRMKPSADGASTAISRMSSAASGGLGKMAGGVRMATLGIAGLAVGMAVMGTSSAMATEKNEAVFGVMLKDAAQGQALVKSLQNTEAAKLFDNQELLDSGRLLFKAGVSAQDLAGKTNQIATIAAATSTEVGDLARIYQQGASSGSFQQDKINQLAERGIDIYHALEAATGKSGAALKDMISGGKIGVTEMDAALAHLTEGNGIYAGSLAVMANTTEGKYKTMKNNISMALGEVMGVALDVMAPIMTMLVSVTAGIRTTFEQFKPAIMFASTAVAWFFTNFIDIAKFAFTSFALFSVTSFNDFVYFFTDTIPAYLNWFSENWANVFMDAGNLIVTVFSNIGKNIGSAMSAIWAYISSGGTAELEFAFVPLLDGFKATVSKLPDVPARAMTELEKSLTAQTEQLGSSLANNFDTMIAGNTAPAGDAALSDASAGFAEGGKEGGKNQRTNFAVGSLDRGSEAALNAIFSAQNTDKTPQKQLGELKKMNGHLAKLTNQKTREVAGAV